jgi:PAS domain S-box-containing protein
MWSDERSRGALTIVKKQRKALRDNDSRVRALVDHVADGIITYDRYGTIRTFNRAAERIFGHPPSAVIGTDINALLPREAGDPTVGTHGEVAGVRANGARFEAAVSIAPVIGSEPPLFVAIVNDVTEQRIAERHIAAQNALTRVLAESPSLDEAARSILRIVGTDIECTAGALWLPTPDARQLERVASWGVSPADERTLVQTEPSGRLPAGRRLAGRVWMTGRAAQAVDPQRLSPHDRLATVQLQTRLGLPLFGKAGVVGVMEFVSARFDTELSKREQVLNIVGQAVGPFIERKQTEAALIESEARYRELFATAHDLIQSVDLNGRVLFVNRAWREALGYTDADLADLNILSVLAPQSREHCTTMLAALARGEAPATPVEMVLLTKSGEEIAVEGSVAVRRDQDHLSTLGIFRNVTAERAVERLKQEFVSTVSHELRTPLASIRGSLGLLAAGALGELSGDAREAVQIADRNVVRLLALINDILDLDRLESGRLDMAFGPCEMKQLISRAVEAVSGFADQRRVRMEVPSSAGEAFADGDRIIQVLVNLLSNAAKFSQPGGVVTLGSEEREGWIAVFVRDKGPGIAPVHRRAIFERFRQIAPPGPKSAGGTGLGLAICKTIVEQHGGRIDVESRENEGSVFWFTIPATAVPLSARGLAAPDLTGC